MASKIVNLDDGNAENETVLLDIWDVARKLGVESAKLVRWERDHKVATPKPSFKIGGTNHWNESQVADWKALYDSQIEADINDLKFSKAMMVDALLDQAKEVERQARRAYNHSRTYNKKNTREAILRVEGIMKFVAALGNSDSYYYSQIEPAEKRDEILELIRKAKDAIGMKD